jgi:hypothetical protein
MTFSVDALWWALATGRGWQSEPTIPRGAVSPRALRPSRFFLDGSLNSAFRAVRGRAVPGPVSSQRIDAGSQSTGISPAVWSHPRSAMQRYSGNQAASGTSGLAQLSQLRSMMSCAERGP